MARVGELLVALGWVTAEQCVQALQAQVLWGARLGTNLVELGIIDLDQLSKALGRQHRMPAALSYHFENADRDLQWTLPHDIAEHFNCIPLLRSSDQVVVAIGAPLDEQGKQIIAFALRAQAADLVLAVAAELRIRYQLERVYKIQRDTRFLRVRGPTPATLPQFDINPVDLSEPELSLPEPDDELSLARTPTRPQFPRSRTAPIVDPSPRPLGSNPQIGIPPSPATPRTPARTALPWVEGSGSFRTLGALPPDDTDVAAKLEDQVAEASLARSPTVDRRAYVTTLGEQEDRTAVGRVPLKRVAIGTESQPPMSLGTNPPPISTTLGEATRAIRRSGNRDTIAHLIVQTVAQFIPGTEAALVLIVRGSAAIAHSGFSRQTESLPEVIIPLDQPGLVASVIARNAPARSPAEHLGPIDFLLLSALGTSEDDLVVCPIAVGDHVIGVIALATKNPTDAYAASITAAAGAAFARLMRDASR